MIELYLGDCLDILKTMPEMSIDAIVTDPPYGLSFMGKKWDYDVPSVKIWHECLRVLKPGGHLLSFAGTRTQHRMAVNIEDAGFEIRDMIAWVYGTGFPKSLDVSKSIDKAAGANRKVVGVSPYYCAGRKRHNWCDTPQPANITAPATEAAHQWNGWGTALKPSLEPITVARRPLVGTVIENVLKYGTGAINVDECRVETTNKTQKENRKEEWRVQNNKSDNTTSVYGSQIGRFPANFIHDGSDEVMELFPETTNNFGSAARFFYCAKLSKEDRNEGCEELEKRTAGECTGRTDGSDGLKSPRAGAGHTSGNHNHHPTVKPTHLMRYLCRLVTPPGGIVLDPFMGSGSTGKAAVLENFNFIGIEREPEYMEIAKRRINFVELTLKSKNDSLDLTRFISDEDSDNSANLENKEL